jgi:hypothetical protein
MSNGLAREEAAARNSVAGAREDSTGGQASVLLDTSHVSGGRAARGSAGGESIPNSPATPPATRGARPNSVTSTKQQSPQEHKITHERLEWIRARRVSLQEQGRQVTRTAVPAPPLSHICTEEIFLHAKDEFGASGLQYTCDVPADACSARRAARSYARRARRPTSPPGLCRHGCRLQGGEGVGMGREDGRRDEARRIEAQRGTREGERQAKMQSTRPIAHNFTT